MAAWWLPDPAGTALSHCRSSTASHAAPPALQSPQQAGRRGCHSTQSWGTHRRRRRKRSRRSRKKRRTGMRRRSRRMRRRRKEEE